LSTERLEQIGREIEVWVEKLDKVGGKAVDYRDTIDRLLGEADKLCGDKDAFEDFKERHCPKLKKSRTYELLAIQQGRKTVEEIREAIRLRVARCRAKKAEVTESDSVTPKSATAQALEKQVEDVIAKLPSSWDTAEESAEARKAEYMAADQKPDAEPTEADAQEAQAEAGDADDGGSDSEGVDRVIDGVELLRAINLVLAAFGGRLQYTGKVSVTGATIELYDAIDAVRDAGWWEVRHAVASEAEVKRVLDAKREAKEKAERAEKRAELNAAAKATPELKKRAENLKCGLERKGEKFYLLPRGNIKTKEFDLAGIQQWLDEAEQKLGDAKAAA
jgi:hypothetical protein